MWRVAWTAVFATLIGMAGAGPDSEGHLDGPGTAPPPHLSPDASEATLGANSSSKGERSRAAAASRRTCAEAKIRCALRSGCGMALQNYMLGCADLMGGRVDHCDEYCKNALIALTSTEEGHDLMDVSGRGRGRLAMGLQVFIFFLVYVCECGFVLFSGLMYFVWD